MHAVVLKYFLEVARHGSLRKAAKVVDKRDALFKTNAQIEAAAPIAPTGN